ncbi:hypothetical protein GCM10009555_021200 [Acrocarpospora macrocephala]|uniref:Putative zinc-finger domain-containing protein n=1 Tax=Acrocarpospora macrocephala TaxID=150177 RepID=A0A5M3WHU2_9ACTN|nr:zf-HC2 domain-containing protein [Acrocarpospora macrocephala]GES07880.1 hypothetical protein Amac_014750 [Acrocarpospora macrocephala]
MTGDTHYDLEILAELAEGLLDDATAHRVRQHLAVCDPCGESLADLATVREMLATVPVPAMPLGVAMRIDRALAAEPNPFAIPAHSAPTISDIPVRPTLTSVSVPADEPVLATVTPLRKPSRGRRAWLTSLGAVAAAAGVFGVTTLATSLFSSPSGTVAEPTTSVSTPDRSPQRALAYTVRASGHNYTSRELSGPLVGYFGPEPGTGTNNDEQLDACVQAKSNELDRAPIAVDRALYNGNEATVMAFWEDQSLDKVRVVVVDDNCHELRQDGLATWN